MELRQLNYFAELCRVRNFTRASQNLNVAQPSVTKAIQQLENELGVRLVDRNQKPLELTKAGKQFYARVEVILKDLDEAVEEVSSPKRDLLQPISIGLSPFTGVLLERLLSQPDAMKQGTLFNLVRRSSTEICTRLMNRELELGWIIRWNLPPELEFLPLEQQEAILLLPPDHPLQFKEEITFWDLRNEIPTIILANPNSVLAQVVLERFRQAGVEPRLDIKPTHHPDLQMAIEWVRNGIGPSFIPQHAAEGITDLPVVSVTPPVLLDVGLVYRKGARLAPGTKKLIRYIQEEYPKLLRQN